MVQSTVKDDSDEVDFDMDQILEDMTTAEEIEEMMED
jgi:hypothetical protein